MANLVTAFVTKLFVNLVANLMSRVAVKLLISVLTKWLTGVVAKHFFYSVVATFLINFVVTLT